ncbi:DUF4032 domain-containing protein [Mobiluncus mulieris]|uniref:DUF4032 domain-containing protein n=2 Tax=Mobiluncus mulieris TaxID=2052 RepID=E0QMI2_9ACTO|nr:DUF4032 domain-containing protein [Mobiluncus mulieris]EEJ53123.1 hypothetical protein HMPREF0577_1798 [Mobiluncus mulieris ATCC 35243]EFM47236.1 hypothetical protein HMPREF0580_0096 [Mobiluncus mulieris ATCC 35239]MCU9969063.1 DUF4032 domain-containing protein [Mobiluncus mulieris]MCU9971528.1 DUF4032 domain-containing protein [Mobiluncus mulieris]MCU9973552.1 DUF4032 domain-containing protein [Mobiluncus mulieris]
MNVSALSITAATTEPDLFDLPWNLPLKEWSEPFIASLPHGISRHVVRFVNLGERILAVKEISAEVAQREYALLRDLVRLEQPTVHPLAVVTNRTSDSGEELNSALITEHLPFSLPYRALFTSLMRPETATRLIDSLAVLLVRLHLAGFFWGDVSLSNTLFRRDAGAFAGYLVDAETGELHPEGLSFGQRSYDIDLARTNIIGELMDLQAGGVLDEDADAIEIGNLIQDRYDALWNELTSEEAISASERWRVEDRIRRLNNLGFDVGELRMKADETGGTSRLLIKPKVVDSGHYHRQVMRLTGLDVQENQGRRMINDMQTYRALNNLNDAPLELVAHRWLTEVFEPIVAALPPELQAKLEPAQIFHEVLEHRWFLSENAKREIPMKEAIDSYIRKILPSKPDEAALLGA